MAASAPLERPSEAPLTDQLACQAARQVAPAFATEVSATFEALELANIDQRSLFGVIKEASDFPLRVNSLPLVFCDATCSPAGPSLVAVF